MHLAGKCITTYATAFTFIKQNLITRPWHYCTTVVLLAFAGVTIVFQKTDRLKKLSFIMWPAADAMNNNFEALPPVILARLKSAETVSLTALLNNYLKTTWMNILAPFTPVRTERAANA